MSSGSEAASWPQANLSLGYVGKEVGRGCISAGHPFHRFVVIFVGKVEVVLEEGRAGVSAGVVQRLTALRVFPCGNGIRIKGSES